MSLSLVPDLIALLVLAEAVAFVALVLLAITMSTLGRREADRRDAARKAWLARVAAEAEGGPGPAGSGDTRLGMTALGLAAEITSRFGGATAERLLVTTESHRARRTAEHWCRSHRWWRRLQGVRALNLLGAEHPDVTHLLYDPRAEVRAEAATWVATHPSTRGINHLLAMLADGSGRCRWAAADALLSLGAVAVDPLRAHLDRNPPRLADTLRIAARLATPTLLPPALRACGHKDPQVRAAAAAAVAAVGGEQAVAALTELLLDDDARVRSAAATGLGALEARIRAHEIAELLHDPVWSVRRSAATALRNLGPAGRQQLRRALTDPDPRASEIAQHVVDLPEGALAVQAS